MAQALQGGITVEKLFIDPEFTALPKNDQLGIIKDIDPDFAALGDTDQFKIYGEMRRTWAANPFERFADTALESGTGGVVNTQENEVRNLADGAAEVLGGIAGGVANAGLGAGVGALLGGTVVPVVGAPLGAYFGQAAGQGLGAFGQTLRDQSDAGEKANYLQAGLEGLGAAGGALLLPGAGNFVKRAVVDGVTQGGIAGVTDALAQASTGKFDPVRTLQRSAMGFGGGLLGAAIPGEVGISPSQRVRQRLAEVQAIQRQQRGIQMAQTVPTLPGQTIRPQYDGSLQSGLKQYSQGKPLQAYAQQVVNNAAPDPRLEQMNAYIANNLDNPAIQAFRPEEVQARALLEAAAKAETVLKQTYEQSVQALKEGKLNEFTLYRSAIKQAIKKQPTEIKKLSAQALDALDEFKAKLKQQELAAKIATQKQEQAKKAKLKPVVLARKTEKAAEAIVEDIAPMPKVLLEAKEPLWPEISKRIEAQPKGRPDLNRSVKFDMSTPASELEASVKAVGFKDIEEAQTWYGIHDFDLRTANDAVPGEIVDRLKALTNAERDVLRTVFDPETGIGLQRDPVKEKDRLEIVAWDSPEYKAAKAKLPLDKQEALDQVEYAAQIDGTINIEYAANKTGATSAREGRLREGVTPLYPMIDKDGKIRIFSSNSEGQHAGYLAQDDKSGSEFLGKVTISGVKAFRGTYPNPFYGQRAYELADPLGLGIREKGIKTSDVEKILSQANQFGAALPKELGNAIKRNPSIANVRLVNEFLTGLQKTPNLNKAFAALLDEAEKTGKLSQMRLQQLRQELGKNKNINDLAELCQLFNLEVID